MICERCGKDKAIGGFPSRNKVCAKVCRYCVGSDARLRLRKSTRSHIEATEKTCQRCLKIKPSYEFPLDDSGHDLMSNCFRCAKKIVQQEKEAKRQEYNRRRRASRPLFDRSVHNAANLRRAFAGMYPVAAKTITYYRTTFTSNGLTITGDVAHICSDCTVLKLDRTAEVEALPWKTGQRMTLCRHCGKAPIRLCSRCHKAKEIVDFGTDPNNDDGLRKRCRRCEDS